MRDPRRDALQHDGSPIASAARTAAASSVDELAGGDGKPRRSENAMADGLGNDRLRRVDMRRTRDQSNVDERRRRRARRARAAAPCSTSLRERADAACRIEKRVDAALRQPRRHGARRRGPARRRPALSARAARPQMTSEISAAFAAIEPTMNSSESMSGSAAMMSSACGSCASASARNAVVGVRSSGLAAVATETSSGRSRSTHSALSAGVVKPVLRALIGAENAVAAAERDHAHAAAARRPCPRLPASSSTTSTSASTECTRITPISSQHGVDDAILADERAGVRLRGTRGGAGHAGLDQHDRLAALPRLFERAHELRAVGDAFEIAADDARARILRERVQVVGEVDDGLVAAAHEIAKAESGLLHHREGRRRDAAALAHHRDRRRGAAPRFRCSAVENVAATGVVALITPTQFGPQSTKSFSRHSATSARCSSAPSPPASASPPAYAMP